MSAERLQKILAHAGIASRRKAEELIEQGLVTVNGKVAQLGDKADLQADHIKVEGKLIHRTEEPVYVAFYKPKGVISMMSDPEGRPTLADYLTKIKVRLFPIGRLDYNSEGLLLLTNDGDLAEKIQKSDQFPRVYSVKIKGHVTSEMLARLERGARINNKSIKPHSVRISEELNKKTKVELVFLNAANVDVKNYVETRGFLVERITRVAFGHITLKGLVPGQYRIVPQSKFQALIDQPELGVKAAESRADKEDEVLPKDLQIDRRRTKVEPSEKRVVVKPLSESEQKEVAKRPARAPRAEGRGFGAPRPYGSPKGERGEKRSFGSPRGERGEKRGFGAPRGARSERGFGAPKGERGEKRGFGAPRGERSERGFGAPRGEKRGFGSPSGQKRGFGGGKPRGFGGGRPGGRPAGRSGAGRGITSVRRKSDR